MGDPMIDAADRYIASQEAEGLSEWISMVMNHVNRVYSLAEAWDASEEHITVKIPHPMSGFVYVCVNIMDLETDNYDESEKREGVEEPREWALALIEAISKDKWQTDPEGQIIRDGA